MFLQFYMILGNDILYLVHIRQNNVIFFGIHYVKIAHTFKMSPINVFN